MTQIAVEMTLEKFLELRETKPASEYVDGRIIQKPMLQGKHSKLQGRLVTAINAVIEPQRIALAFPELRCTFGDRSIINAVIEPQRIALAFPELRCTFGDRSIVSDIAVFTWNRILWMKMAMLLIRLQPHPTG